LIEKAAGLWGKAARRSVARSALVEAVEQFTGALAQIASSPATRASRQQEINFQVAVITPLIHVKGYSAPETKAAVERARLLIEQAKAIGEPPEDPLLLFSVLYGSWVVNLFAFNGDACRDVAVQILAIAESQGATVPLMMGHRCLGASLLLRGELAKSRAHLDRAFALYDPVEHQALATRFGQDPGVTILTWRSWAVWDLGYPEAALTDADRAIKDARDIGQAATLMVALVQAVWTYGFCGRFVAASPLVDEVVVLAGEKDAAWWKAFGALHQGRLFALTGKASVAIQTITSAMAKYRSTGSTLTCPTFLSYLSGAYAELGKLEDAWRCIGEAMTLVETNKERWYQAEINRVAGEIALKSPEHDAAKAEAYFERALAVARQQQAKSWELRAAMSMAGLWREQGKVREARELLAPVYGWFTEGFDTRDLTDAKALLDALAS
jgi:predicted ATPase